MISKNKSLVLLFLLGSFTLSAGMNNLGYRLLEKARQAVLRHPVASGIVAVGSVVTIAAVVRKFMAQRAQPVAQGQPVSPGLMPEGRVSTAVVKAAQAMPGVPVLGEYPGDVGVGVGIQFPEKTAVELAGLAVKKELSQEAAGMRAAMAYEIADTLCAEGVRIGTEAELARQQEQLKREEAARRKSATHKTFASDVAATADASLDSVVIVDPVDVVDAAHSYQENSKRGGQYLAKLWLNMPGLTMPTPDTNSYNTGDVQFVQAVVDIIWYLYAEAQKKGEEFEEGTFILKDPGLTLFNTLLEYVKLCDPIGTIVPGWDTEKYISQRFAYCRASSHLKEYYKATGQEKLHHYGIYPDLQGVTALPANKHHIFFGCVDPKKELIFIKPENAGLSLSFKEIGRHGAELARGIAVKKMGSSYDDAPNFRKERVPKELRKTFNKIFTDDAVHIEGLGIQHMIKIGLDYQDEEIRQLARNCYAQYDHISIRMGREVIITPNDIVSAILYSMNGKCSIAECAAMGLIIKDYETTKKCIREIKLGNNRADNKVLLRTTYKSLQEKLKKVQINGQYAAIIPQLSQYCDMLDIFYYAPSDSAFIEGILFYGYCLEDLTPRDVWPRYIQENAQRRDEFVRKQEAIIDIGRDYQEYVDAQIRTAQKEFVLDASQKSIDSSTQVVLDAIFDQYYGLRKSIRDFKQLGVIDIEFPADVAQHNLQTIVLRLLETLKELAAQFNRETIEQNNQVLNQLGASLFKYLSHDIKMRLLDICGKKSTGDMKQYHVQMTQELKRELERIFSQAIIACEERLFGSKDAEIRQAPRTCELDEAQFTKYFVQTKAQDVEQHKMRAHAIVESFSTEEAFIDKSLSCEDELCRLKQLRIDSYSTLCSMGLQVHMLEQEVAEYAKKLKHTLTATAPVQPDSPTAAAAYARQAWGWLTNSRT